MEKTDKIVKINKLSGGRIVRWMVRTNMFSRIRSRIAPDIGIDLGSTNTRVCVVGRGVVLEIPSALAINMKTDQVVEVGEKAKDYLEHRAGDVIVVGPLKNGRIADVGITAAFLRYCIEKVSPRHWWRKILKPRVLITVQSGVTEVEKFAMGRGCCPRPKRRGWRRSI